MPRPNKSSQEAKIVDDIRRETHTYSSYQKRLLKSQN